MLFNQLIDVISEASIIDLVVEGPGFQRGRIFFIEHVVVDVCEMKNILFWNRWKFCF